MQRYYKFCFLNFLFVIFSLGVGKKSNMLNVGYLSFHLWSIKIKKHKSK